MQRGGWQPPLNTPTLLTPATLILYTYPVPYVYGAKRYKMTKPSAPRGSLVTIDGERYYRIDGVQRMEPFLLSVVSDSDLWMWVSSTGALTAGRVDTDGALFPYYPDDHLHQLAGLSGPVTVIVRRRPDGSREVWQPLPRGCGRAWSGRSPSTTWGTASSSKRPMPRGGGVVFRTSWSPSQTYGWVRESELIDTRQNGDRMALEVMDGWWISCPRGFRLTWSGRFQPG